MDDDSKNPQYAFAVDTGAESELERFYTLPRDWKAARK